MNVLYDHLNFYNSKILNIQNQCVCTVLEDVLSVFSYQFNTANITSYLFTCKNWLPITKLTSQKTKTILYVLLKK